MKFLLKEKKMKTLILNFQLRILKNENANSMCLALEDKLFIKINHLVLHKY